MARPNHYSPAIRGDLVGLLYHEAKHRSIPMTKLVDQLLRNALEADETTRILREPRKDYPQR
ncbi:hypothetical protein HZ994_11570 [Akkermansiaceae bacterium]|nr:hypothetical protein HZ994_11570 [Akkermansiaceae bacterium]